MKLRYGLYISEKGIEDLLDQINEELDAENIFSLKIKSEEVSHGVWEDYDSYDATVWKAEVIYRYEPNERDYAND